MSPKKILRYQGKGQKSHAEYEALFTAILFQMDRGVDKSELIRRLVSNLDLDFGSFATGPGLTGKLLAQMVGDRIGRTLTELEKEKLDSLLTAGQMRLSEGWIESLRSGSGGGLFGSVIYKKAGDDPNSKPMDDSPRPPLDGLGGFFKK